MDADDRYLHAIAEDCQLILGPGVDILGLERADVDDALDGASGEPDPDVRPDRLTRATADDQGDPAAVRLVLRYQLDGWEAESTAVGPTVVAAHADLRRRLVIDRLRLGFAVTTDRSAPAGSPHRLV
jgi:hypothetical protein